MKTDTRQSIEHRLARVEGQVRGLSAMVREDRYCMDVIAQVRAARAALAKVEQAILADHLSTCVETAIMSGIPSSSAGRSKNWSTSLAARIADHLVAIGPDRASA